MKKILIIFTGGTIGSTIDGNIIGLNKKDRFHLISAYRAKFGCEDTFESVEAFSMLSENMSLEKQIRLAKIISSVDTDLYEGVIVTHGSDTLAFSAAVLGYLLDGFSLPVVLVASNRPPDDRKANGIDNLRGAILFLRSFSKGGVYVSWRNSGERSVRIFAGTRVKPQPALEETLSAVGTETARIAPDGKIHYRKSTVKKDEADRIILPPDPLFPNVLYLQTYPDMGETLTPLAHRNTDAVLLIPYHSSTLPTSLPSFVDFCRNMTRLGILVFTVCEKRDTIYASSTAFRKLSVIPLEGISPSAAYEKIRLLFACGRRQDVTKRIAGDKI